MIRIARSLTDRSHYFIFRNDGTEIRVKTNSIPFQSSKPLRTAELEALKNYMMARNELDEFNRLFK